MQSSRVNPRRSPASPSADEKTQLSPGDGTKSEPPTAISVAPRSGAASGSAHFADEIADGSYHSNSVTAPPTRVDPPPVDSRTTRTSKISAARDCGAGAAQRTAPVLTKLARVSDGLMA